MLEVETEVGERRDGFHRGAVDAAVGVEREGDVGVGEQGAVIPAGDEGVLLPVFHPARQLG